MWRGARTILAMAAALAAMSSTVAAQDRQAGYYYPEPSSEEVYEARVPTLPDSDRQRRIGFVTGVTAGQTERPYPPITAMFAKGAEAEKLILLGLQDGPMDTLFRARAMLALLTATARTTPVFQDIDPEGRYTFLDLLKLLGFAHITVSDGRDWSHRILIR